MFRIAVSVLLALMLISPAWAAADQFRELRVAVATKAGGAQTMVAQRFAELVQKAAPAAWRVRVLLGGEAGDESQILARVRAGQLEACVVTDGVYDGYCPAVRVVEHPFLFDDYAQVDRLLDGEPGREVLKALEPAGLAGLGFSENGFRQLTNNLRPVRTPDDLKGLRLRTMESVVQSRLWELLGAVAVPHPWPINQFLARGGADGQENPLWVLSVYELYKLQKHLSLTAHVYSAHIGAANLAWWRGLSPADRRLLTQAFAQAARQQKDSQRAGEAAVLKLVEAKGMQVVQAPDRAAFKARSAGIDQLDIYREPKTAELLALFRRALAR